MSNQQYRTHGRKLSPAELVEPRAYTLQERTVELAEEQLCTAERFGTWLQNVNDVRQSSATFGPIGNCELVRLALKLENTENISTHSQVFAAIRTLRRRFLAEHCEEIAQMVADMMEEMEEDK